MYTKSAQRGETNELVPILADNSVGTEFAGNWQKRMYMWHGIANFGD